MWRHKCLAEASSCLLLLPICHCSCYQTVELERQQKGNKQLGEKGEDNLWYCLCPGTTVRAQLYLQKFRIWATLCKRSDVCQLFVQVITFISWTEAISVRIKVQPYLMVILHLVSKQLIQHMGLEITMMFLASEEDWGNYPLLSHMGPFSQPSPLSTILTGFLSCL